MMDARYQEYCETVQYRRDLNCRMSFVIHSHPFRQLLKEAIRSWTVDGLERRLLRKGTHCMLVAVQTPDCWTVRIFFLWDGAWVTTKLGDSKDYPPWCPPPEQWENYRWIEPRQRPRGGGWQPGQWVNVVAQAEEAARRAYANRLEAPVGHFSGCYTPDQIRKRYRQLCSQHHPDKGGNAEIMAAINVEYGRLTPRRPTT